MTAKMEILELKDCGDSIRVKLQGKKVKQADWQPMLTWEIQVPVYIGSTYRLGQTLTFKVTV